MNRETNDQKPGVMILAIAASLANSVHGIQKTDPIAEKLRDRPESEVDPAVKRLRKGNDLINPESEVLRGVRPLSGAVCGPVRRHANPGSAVQVITAIVGAGLIVFIIGWGLREVFCVHPSISAVK